MDKKTLRDGAVLTIDESRPERMRWIVGYPDCPECKGTGEVTATSRFYGNAWQEQCFTCSHRYQGDKWRCLVWD